MTKFFKYSSIENHYQQKFINSFINQFGSESLKQKFIISEKLDGANIQLVFSPNQEMKVGKRTSYLEPTESFFDIWNTLKKYQKQIDVLQNFANENNEIIVVYGEIYGIGINGRINYGDKKFISFFDIIRNEDFISQSELYQLFAKLDLLPMLPSFQITCSLAQAMEIEVPEGKEGFVIQPFDKVIRLGSGSRFILKKKSSGFDDKVSPKVKDKRDAGGNAFNLKFREYINENRLKDLFSKHGEIEKPQQIPDYIRLMIEDAKVDFLKDHDISAFESKEQKEIFNIGSVIVSMLKKYL